MRVDGIMIVCYEEEQVIGMTEEKQEAGMTVTPEDEMYDGTADDEKIMEVAHRILELYKSGFERLAE